MYGTEPIRTNQTFSPYKHQINITLCLHLHRLPSIRLGIFLALSHYSDCATRSATHHEAFKILSGCNVRRLAACGFQSLAMIIQHQHAHASINTDISGKKALQQNEYENDMHKKGVEQPRDDLGEIRLVKHFWHMKEGVCTVQYSHKYIFFQINNSLKNTNHLQHWRSTSADRTKGLTDKYFITEASVVRNAIQYCLC